MKISTSCLVIPQPVSTSSFPTLRVTHGAAPPRLEQLNLLLFCLQKSAPNNVSRRDAICSDPSNSRQGHGCLSAIRQGRRRGRREKMPESKLAFQLISLPSADRTIRPFTQAGSQVGDVPLTTTPNPCANTRLCINTHMHWMTRAA